MGEGGKGFKNLSPGLNKVKLVIDRVDLFLFFGKIRKESF